MANPDYRAGAFFKSEGPSRLEQRAAKVKDREQQQRDAYQQVDRRDNYRCRACGSQCDPHAIDMLGKGHRHHLEYRSKGGQDVASNLLTLCSRCHDAEHRKVLRIEPETPHGGDGPVEIYRKSPEGTWYLSRREVSVGVIERD